jgi:hypothetical protein
MVTLMLLFASIFVLLYDLNRSNNYSRTKSVQYGFSSLLVASKSVP